LDALLAVTVAVFMLFFSTTMLASINFVQDDYLLRYMYDLLSVLEKDGTLNDIIDGDSSGFRNVVTNLPPSICIELDITTSKGKDVYHGQNFCRDGNKLFIVSRIVTYNDAIYLATVKTWYKQDVLD